MVAAPNRADIEDALARVASIPDYPAPGVIFRDMLPLLADARAFDTAVRAMIAPFNGEFDVVAGVEARGFLLAGAAAALAGCGLVPIRKAGKLPRPAVSQAYTLEYATATLEMQNDLAPGTRVLILDDVLATGGTVDASVDLVRELGHEVAGVSVLLELAGLDGRARLGDLPVATLATIA